jgi:hypothetical protein
MDFLRKVFIAVVIVVAVVYTGGAALALVGATAGTVGGVVVGALYGAAVGAVIGGVLSGGDILKEGLNAKGVKEGMLTGAVAGGMMGSKVPTDAPSTGEPATGEPAANSANAQSSAPPVDAQPTNYGLAKSGESSSVSGIQGQGTQGAIAPQGVTSPTGVTAPTGAATPTGAGMTPQQMYTQSRLDLAASNAQNSSNMLTAAKYTIGGQLVTGAITGQGQQAAAEEQSKQVALARDADKLKYDRSVANSNAQPTIYQTRYAPPTPSPQQGFAGTGLITTYPRTV